MSKFKSLALIAALSSSSALAMDTNIDIVNQGPDAYDFAVVLKGAEQIYETYNGPAYNQNFNNVSKLQIGGNTFIHWQNPSQGVIPSGSKFHIGWSSLDHDTDVVDMYFTDKFGQRIKCSTALVVSGHFDPVTNTIGIAHTFDTAVAIEARNVRVAVLSAAIPLAALNPLNQELMAQLRPVASLVKVGPGETVRIPSPVRPQPGQAVVVVFDVTGEGTDAGVLSFNQTAVLKAGATNKQTKVEIQAPTK